MKVGSVRGILLKFLVRGEIYAFVFDDSVYVYADWYVCGELRILQLRTNFGHVRNSYYEWAQKNRELKRPC